MRTIPKKLIDPRILTNETESKKLWIYIYNHVSLGVRIMEEYQQLGLPHFPEQEMQKLQERLDQLCQHPK